MARPTTKPELMQSASLRYDAMRNLIEAMGVDEQNAPFDFGEAFPQKEAHWQRDKNLRDVLVHLYEWHNLLLDWVELNQKGKQQPFLPVPYNWKTYGKMNFEFWEKHQKTSLEDSIAMVNDSHARVMVLIDSFSNDELFTKGHFSWAGTSALGSYCVSATASHYDWAIKKIKAHNKTYRHPDTRQRK